MTKRKQQTIPEVLKRQKTKEQKEEIKIRLGSIENENYKRKEIAGDTPIILRKSNGKISIKTIETIINDGTKFQIWSKDGWVTFKILLIHKTNKKIYRINTHSGCVDVTKDHNLINKQGTEIKPTECVVKTTKMFQTY